MAKGAEGKQRLANKLAEALGEEFKYIIIIK